MFTRTPCIAGSSILTSTKLIYPTYEVASEVKELYDFLNDFCL